MGSLTPSFCFFVGEGSGGWKADGSRRKQIGRDESRRRVAGVEISGHAPSSGGVGSATTLTEASDH